MRKLMCLLILSFAFVFLGADNVDAATATFKNGGAVVHLDDGHCCTRVGKKIVDSNGKSATAYCLELDKDAPANNAKMKSKKLELHSKKALIAGKIIELGRDRFKGNNQYVKIQEALNCVFDYSGRHTGTCNNSTVKNLIAEAQKDVKLYKTSTKITNPAFSDIKNLKVASVNGDTVNYISDKVTVSKLEASYFGGDKSNSTKPKYDISATASVAGARAYICPNATFNNQECKASLSFSGRPDYSFYVYVANGGKKSGNVTVTITGKNTSEYPSVTVWESSQNKQVLATFVKGTSIPLKRATDAVERVFSYSEEGKNTVSIAKVDESGNPLEGAKLTLFTASKIDEHGVPQDTKNICTVGNSDATKTSCSQSIGDADRQNYGYTNGRLLCYSEEKAPSGYKKVETQCHEINIGQNTVEYYINGEKVDSAAEYYKYDRAKKACLTNTEDNFDDTYVNSQLNGAFTDGEELEVKEGVTTLKLGPCDSTSATSSDEGDGTTPSTVYSKTICVAGDKTYDSTNKYCDQVIKNTFEQSGGDANVLVTNALNTVNISKKAIAGTEEVPGATLSIYTTDSGGKCTTTLAKAKRFEFQESKATDEDDSEGGDSSGSGDSSGTDEGGSSSDEGSSSSDEGQGEDEDESIVPEDVPSIEDGLKWVSSDAPAIIYGLAAGNYCMVEEVPPLGYKKLKTTTKFSMDDTGKVELIDAGSSEITDEKSPSGNIVSTITLFNTLTDVTISKTDIATTKELPGATLSICEAYKNDKGKYEPVLGYDKQCTVTTLADGSKATWVSTNTPHKVSGLGVGTYYLVEVTAPDGYAKAESILFTVQDDGTLTDINGKSLANNKLTMYDAHVRVPSTAANISLIIVIVALLLFLLAAYGTYCVYKDKEMFPFIKKIKNKSSKK